MQDLNAVLIEGLATRDAECKYTSGGTAIAEISLANNRSYKKGEEWEKETSFIDVTVWGKQAELAAEHVKKGVAIRVVGRLKQDRWQDSNGGARSKVGVVAEYVEWRTERKSEEGA